MDDDEPWDCLNECLSIENVPGHLDSRIPEDGWKLIRDSLHVAIPTVICPRCVPDIESNTVLLHPWEAEAHRMALHVARTFQVVDQLAEGDIPIVVFSVPTIHQRTRARTYDSVRVRITESVVMCKLIRAATVIGWQRHLPAIKVQEAGASPPEGVQQALCALALQLAARRLDPAVASRILPGG